MKERVGICTWSLGNDLEKVSRVMEESSLSRLHLAVTAKDEFSQIIEQKGWSISCTMVGFPQEDYSTLDTIRRTGGIIPDEHWERNRAIALEAMDASAQMGVPYLSTHAGFIDHRDADAYKVFCGRMLELADAAQANDIQLLLETGQETAEELLDFLKENDHPALGVNFDPANMILYGKGNPVDAVEKLAPWIRHVHIKDAIASKVPGEWGAEVPWGEGEVGADDFIQTLEKIGYQGALAIEREAGDARMNDILSAAVRLGVKP